MGQRAGSSIRVSDETRRAINARKQEGDTHEDVVSRLLRKADALDAVESEEDATEERLALAELKLRESRQRADVLEQRVEALQRQLMKIESLTEIDEFDPPEPQIDPSAAPSIDSPTDSVE